MVAEYPGSAYTPNIQSTGTDDPGNPAVSNGGDYNKHDEELGAISGDLRAAFDKPPYLQVDTMAKLADMLVPVHQVFVGNESSRAFDGSNDERMRIQGSFAMGPVSTGNDPWIIASKTPVDGALTFAAAGKTITLSGHSLNFTQRSFKSGMIITISGSSSNDGTYLTSTVTDTVITLDAGETLINEGPTASVSIASESLVMIAPEAEGNYRATVRFHFELSAGAQLTYQLRLNGTAFLSGIFISFEEDVTANVKASRSMVAYWDVSSGDWFDVLIGSDTAMTMTDPTITVDFERTLKNVFAL